MVDTFLSKSVQKKSCKKYMRPMPNRTSRWTTSGPSGCSLPNAVVITCAVSRALFILTRDNQTVFHGALEFHKVYPRDPRVATNKSKGNLLIVGRLVSTKLLGDLNTGFSLQSDHLIGTSAHAPQRPIVTYTGMGSVDPDPRGLLHHGVKSQDLEANAQVQNVKLGGHQTCLSINRLWHELCDVRRLVGTTAPRHHDCSIQE
ncbi:hypothetical protein TNCV_2930771 [Trichonephila clavipes]|nr:hypothetical protein TNCV_2930771 [Trichonephila clavipes]